MPKIVREAMNRGNNLVIIVFLAVLSIGVVAELFIEPEILDKADDAFIILLGIAGVIWYLRGQNRYQYSWMPFTLLALAFVGKLLAFANEFNDPASVGDEYGIIPTLLAMLIVSGVIVARSRRANREIGEPVRIDNLIPQTGEPKDQI